MVLGDECVVDLHAFVVAYEEFASALVEEVYSMVNAVDAEVRSVRGDIEGYGVFFCGGGCRGWWKIFLIRM